MENDKIIKVFKSGQKNVALVKNKKYGLCIRKTKKDNTSTARIVREIEIQNKFDCKYYPKLYYSDINSKTMLIYEEYIEGSDLAEIFRDINVYKNNEIKCLLLLRELIKGLKYIWNNSIVHRDLKPQNIIIRSDESPVILDLGIAKILDGGNSTTRVWFTEGYAPIEQFTSQIKMIDKRTDFFSLGVIIYEMFFGIRLFQTNDDVISKEPIFVVKGYNNSEGFNKILSKMLEKRIYDRYRKTDDILFDMEKILEVISNE